MSLFGKAILRSLMLAALSAAALPSGQAEAVTQLPGCFCGWKAVQVTCQRTYCDGSKSTFSGGTVYFLESYGNQGESGNCGGRLNDANMGPTELCGPNTPADGNAPVCLLDPNPMAAACSTKAICPGSGHSDPNSIFASMPPAPTFTNGYPDGVPGVFAKDFGVPALSPPLSPPPSPASGLSLTDFGLSLSDPSPPDATKTWNDFSEDCRKNAEATTAGRAVVVDGNGNTYRWELDGRYHLIARDGDTSIKEKLAKELAVVKEKFGRFASSLPEYYVQQEGSHWHKIPGLEGETLMQNDKGHVYRLGVDGNGEGTYRYVGESASHVAALEEGGYYVKPIVVETSEQIKVDSETEFKKRTPITQEKMEKQKSVVVTAVPCWASQACKKQN